MNTNHIVTLGDLEKFKVDLFIEIRRFFKAANEPPVKKWLKSKEVMKLLEISPGKLQTMRNSGVIAFMKIGGSIYYDHEDIQAMFDKNKTAFK